MPVGAVRAGASLELHAAGIVVPASAALDDDWVEASGALCTVQSDAHHAADEQVSEYREAVRPALENKTEVACTTSWFVRLMGFCQVSAEDRARLNALRKQVCMHGHAGWIRHARQLRVTVEMHIEILAMFKWSLLDFLDGEKSSTEA